VLNQEYALGAPCLVCDFCSPQAPSQGAGMLRTGVIRRFVSHLLLLHPGHHADMADAFSVVGGSARVKCTGAGPNRAVAKAALTCGFLLP
jgi:hypothetical protein